VALLAKTANQWPSQLPKFKEVLEHGGTYEDVLATTHQIKAHNRVYDGLDAVAVAERYKAAFDDPGKAPALERAQAKVVREGFDPSTQATDSDIKEALHAIGQRGRAPATNVSDSLRIGSHGHRVADLQSQLAALNITDGNGHPLSPDGHFGASTQAAVEKFQSAHGMTVDGIVGRRTETVLQQEVAKAQQDTRLSLADVHHPGVSLYRQAFGGVRGLDEERGRTSDQASCHLAGSLAVAACSAGLHRIDHVAMSDDGARAYAIQGDLNSPFKRYTEVNVAHSVTIPLEQSGADFVRVAAEQAQQPSAMQPQQHTQQQEATAQQPEMHR
jgi:peptidoglycan hydrolase-like protein with peptidoglycan-binding domain